ncbi:hypothetical protein [Pseudomonas duriflava]
MKVFSPRNLKYMRTFAQAWPDKPFRARSACTITLGPPAHAPGQIQDQ